MTKGDRADSVAREVVDRVRAEVATALRRRPSHEGRLAGALRVMSPHSAVLRAAGADALALLVRRSSFSRELYVGLVRALAEAGDERAAPLIAKAAAAEEAGGFSTLSAACFLREPELASPLARLAASRHAHLAFAAEIARMCRRESDGAHLVAIAPKIKESHRIALCVEMFVPLTRGSLLPPSVGPALAVLRDAERHLGRWLVLAEVATRASDPGPLQEASLKAKNGPSSARAAWTLVAWALSGGAPPPATRPTVELVARLSDRPSADRDTTFLFRLAAARCPSARPMLESLTRTLPLADEVSVRAAMYLARDHGREELSAALDTAARSARREDLRGMALAALWDAGGRELALGIAQQASGSKALSTCVWAALVRMAASSDSAVPVLDEATFRRAQWGWLE
jgi:hypothetical protein